MVRTRLEHASAHLQNITDIPFLPSVGERSPTALPRFHSWIQGVFPRGRERLERSWNKCAKGDKGEPGKRNKEERKGVDGIG